MSGADLGWPQQSWSSLRTDLLGDSEPDERLVAAAAPAAVAVLADTAGQAQRPALDGELVPAAIIEEWPAVARLCSGFESSYRALVARGRRQRIGVGLLVGAVETVGVVLSQQQQLASASLTLVVAGATVTAGLAVLLMALLWRRDRLRLEQMQGPRLVRALQVAGGPADLRRRLAGDLAASVSLFLDCHRAWKLRHAGHAAHR